MVSGRKTGERSAVGSPRYDAHAMTASTAPTDTPSSEVLEAFGLAADTLETTSSGLINRSWYARSTAGDPLVLQRVNAIFAPETNADIDVVTRHLRARGLMTPTLVPTLAGALWFESGGAVWRVLTRIDGVIHDSTESPARAAEAGRILGEFHAAVSDLEHRFANIRLGVHDTQRHLANLRSTVTSHTAHPRYRSVARLAARVEDLATGLTLPRQAPDRIVHGDPKLENIMFDPDTGRALCMIDLDTVTTMSAAIELGDALRSWCNPAAEDSGEADFSIELFEAAVEAYAAASDGLLDATEWRAIPDAAFAIAVELAARFCADALAERYFAWDRYRYTGAAEHNEARTLGQLAVADGMRRERARMHAAVERTFGP